MNSAIERLLALRVKDVMTGDVVTLRDNLTMEAAGKILHENGVSGAPVVDEDGTCIGVLSVSDFVVNQTVGVGGDGRQQLKYEHMLSGLDGALTGSPEELVCDHMTLLIRSISAEASLLQAARFMCEQHIHRLVILGDDEQPVGVVSTLDFVAATIAAIEE